MRVRTDEHGAIYTVEKGERFVFDVVESGKMIRVSSDESTRAAPFLQSIVLRAGESREIKDSNSGNRADQFLHNMILFSLESERGPFWLLSTKPASKETEIRVMVLR